MNTKLQKFVPMVGLTLMFTAHCVQASSTNLINSIFDYAGDVVGGLPVAANGTSHGGQAVANFDVAPGKTYITNGISGGGFAGQSLASFSQPPGTGQANENIWWSTSGRGLNYTYVTNTFGTDKQYLRVSFDINPGNGQMQYGLNSASGLQLLTVNNVTDGPNRYWRVIASDANPHTTNTFGTWSPGIVQNVLVEVDLRNSLYRLDIDGVYGPTTPMPPGIAYQAQTPSPVNSVGFGRFLIWNNSQGITSYTDNFKVEVWSNEIPEPTSVALLSMAGFLMGRRFLRRSG